MLKNQTGSTVIMGITVMMFLILASAGLMPWITNELKIIPMSKDILQAEYAAEAGAKRAIIEFFQANSAQTQDWTWLGRGCTLISDPNTNYTVLTFLTSDVSETTPVTPNTTTNNSYTIRSIGTVAGKAVKVVRVIVDVIGSGSGGGGGSGGGNGGSGNDVFSKYSLFSNGQIQISNTPIIKGDIASNSTIQVNTSNTIINGVAYTTAPPNDWQHAWNKNAVSGGYIALATPETLDVNSMIPTMPTMPTLSSITGSATNLATVTGTTSSVALPNSSYYYNGTYQTGKTHTLSSGQTVIYVYGNLQLSQVSGYHAGIIGNDVTIYVSGDFLMDNNSYIQANTLKIYVQGSIKLTNNAKINAESVTIQTTSTAYGSINFGSDSSINKNSATAITKIYSNGDVEFTNQFKIGGKAGLVVAKGAFNINSSTNAQTTVFVSGSGTTGITNNVKIGGIYTNGSLNINSSPNIDFGDQKNVILDALGLTGDNGNGNGGGGSGTASVTIRPGSWSVK